ncbi:MAG: DUF11 domain-containing protein, partial [Caldilinea sp.]|nr:DUF11 domain-containing protein [Caldilinea sp.]
WVANPTILSGDIDGDDTTVGGVVTTTANIVGTNSYHVLWLEGVKGDPSIAATRIDGFTITAGKASGADQPHSNGGGLYCAGNGEGNVCSPDIVNTIFSGNSASSYGGAMYNGGFMSGISSPNLVNVAFSGNSAVLGGAVYNSSGQFGNSSPSLVNVTFSGNSAVGYGGAMYNAGMDAARSDASGTSSPSLVNVTFSGNSAGTEGSAMINMALSSLSVSRASLTNVILWGNTSTSGSGAQISNVGADATLTISHTLIPSNTADIFNIYGSIVWGPGNITDGSNPRFVDASNGDLRLEYFSPAINAGDSAAIIATGVATDLAGNARIQGTTVDLGAYEYTPAPAVTLTKSVAPDADVAYQGIVTYTLLLANNGAVADSGVTVTDTLPAGVAFAGWVEQPAGATFAGNALTWNGAVEQAEVITFTFAATNTASGGATVTNTAWFSGSAQSGSNQVTYTATPDCYPEPYGSGDWTTVYAHCQAGARLVIPDGITVTLDADTSLAGDLDVRGNGVLDATSRQKKLTLTGNATQAFTGTVLSFYQLTLAKTNPTDIVGINGHLQVTDKLLVSSGKLISASDYGDIEIEENGELQLT